MPNSPRRTPHAPSDPPRARASAPRSWRQPRVYRLSAQATYSGVNAGRNEVLIVYRPLDAMTCEKNLSDGTIKGCNNVFTAAATANPTFCECIAS